MRIKYIIPFPFSDVGIAKRAAQIPYDILGENTQVECVTVRDGGTVIDCYYDGMLFDMYVVEAGLRAEEEGFDAVVMDTVSDSGLFPLRSRLSIPVIGPGIVSYAIASILGKRFSIITMSERWIRPIYEKNLDTYGLRDKCASIRSVEMSMNLETLFSADSVDVFERLTIEARRAIEEDRADVILLGSTTMHEAVAYMSERLDAPVINPGPVAIKIAESIVQLGLSHSKVAFASPSVIQDKKFHSLSSANSD